MRRAPQDLTHSARPSGALLRRRTWRATGRRALWRRGVQRRAAAAVLVAGASWLAVGELAPPPPPTVPVVVATRAVAVGEALGPDNLVVRDLPAEAVPDGAPADLGSVAGTHAVTPIGAGEVVTQARTRTEPLLRGVDGDRVAAYVPVPDPPLLTLLAPGTRVDLLSTADGAVLASRVAVLTRPATTSGGWDAGSAPAGLLVAVTPAEAARLAVATGSGLPGQAIAVVILPGDR